MKYKILNVGQVSKGLRWMPWDQGPTKGVARLRKASVSCLASLAGDSRMEETGPGNAGSPRLVGGVSRGTETSKYPEENKSTEIPLVVANERGRAQTRAA